MFQNYGGTGSAPRLPVLALADDIQTVIVCLTDKFRKAVDLREVCIKCQSVIRKNVDINVENRRCKNPFGLSFVINGR